MEMCHECLCRPQTTFCCDCNVSHCAECSANLHRARTFQSHQRIAFSGTVKVSKCPTHQQDVIRYCCECKKGVCPLCSFDGNCKTHTLKSFEGMVQQQRSILDDKLSKMNNEITRVADMSTKTVDAIKAIQQSKEDSTSAVMTTINELKAALDRRANQLISQITQITAHKVNCLSRQRQQLQVLQHLMSWIGQEAASAIDNIATVQQQQVSPPHNTRVHSMLGQHCVWLNECIDSTLNQWSSLLRTTFGNEIEPEFDVSDAGRIVGGDVIRVDWDQCATSLQSQSPLSSHDTILSQISSLGSVVDFDSHLFGLSRGLEWLEHQVECNTITLKWKCNDFDVAFGDTNDSFVFDMSTKGITKCRGLGIVSLDKFVVSCQQAVTGNDAECDNAVVVNTHKKILVTVLPQQSQNSSWTCDFKDLKDSTLYCFTVTAHYRHQHDFAGTALDNSTDTNSCVFVVSSSVEHVRTTPVPVHLRFVKISDAAVVLSKEGTTLTHNNGTNYQYGLSDILCGSVVVWKFVVLNLPVQDDRLICAIIANDNPLNDSYFDGSYFGWFGWKQKAYSFKNGKGGCSGPEISGWDGYRSGDVVVMKLDVIKATLSLKHIRTNTIHTITDLPEQYKTQWRFCLNTTRPQTIVELLPVHSSDLF
eukprot:c9578_g1_i1.p1 GENE.c9578_g1_i1~~c9578_g1_i1.p1  ORF type:complete len:646 (+),score=139.46 c9578_g1_i1:478-2415(+)